jgi:hypothetical protein
MHERSDLIGGAPYHQNLLGHRLGGRAPGAQGERYEGETKDAKKFHCQLLKT